MTGELTAWTNYNVKVFPDDGASMGIGIGMAWHGHGLMMGMIDECQRT